MSAEGARFISSEKLKDGTKITLSAVLGLVAGIGLTLGVKALKEKIEHRNDVNINIPNNTR